MSIQACPPRPKQQRLPRSVVNVISSILTLPGGKQALRLVARYGLVVCDKIQYQGLGWIRLVLANLKTRTEAPVRLTNGRWVRPAAYHGQINTAKPMDSPTRFPIYCGEKDGSHEF